MTTSYKLEFIPEALKEWKRLDAALKRQLVKKLAEIVANPHIPSARLWGHPNAYRIKARKAGYRLIYEVDDMIVTVYVVAIGRRDRNEVYKMSERRLAARERD